MSHTGFDFLIIFYIKIIVSCSFILEMKEPENIIFILNIIRKWSY